MLFVAREAVAEATSSSRTATSTRLCRSSVHISRRVFSHHTTVIRQAPGLASRGSVNWGSVSLRLVSNRYLFRGCILLARALQVSHQRGNLWICSTACCQLCFSAGHSALQCPSRYMMPLRQLILLSRIKSFFNLFWLAWDRSIDLLSLLSLYFMRIFPLTFCNPVSWKKSNASFMIVNTRLPLVIRHLWPLQQEVTNRLAMLFVAGEVAAEATTSSRTTTRTRLCRSSVHSSRRVFTHHTTVIRQAPGPTSRGSVN
ncbi:unnamed protein product [Cuscuta epithymum]|uniref:Uncharacterized protein n=1 Tax=Cuscuta epithymum TaxID=186058 RepID=A0AAV0G667_9ASTE|nr:unnamed protein product [Cuscuta epithymum]